MVQKSHRGDILLVKLRKRVCAFCLRQPFPTQFGVNKFPGFAIKVNFVSRQGGLKMVLASPNQGVARPNPDKATRRLFTKTRNMKQTELPTLYLRLLLFAALFLNARVVLSQSTLAGSFPPEDCFNGLDDDADGYIDCYDVDCHCFDPPDCATTIHANQGLKDRFKTIGK